MGDENTYDQIRDEALSGSVENAVDSAFEYAVGELFGAVPFVGGTAAQLALSVINSAGQAQRNKGACEEISIRVQKSLEIIAACKPQGNIKKSQEAYVRVLREAESYVKKINATEDDSKKNILEYIIKLFSAKYISEMHQKIIKDLDDATNDFYNSATLETHEVTTIIHNKVDEINSKFDEFIREAKEKERKEILEMKRKMEEMEKMEKKMEKKKKEGKNEKEIIRNKKDPKNISVKREKTNKKPNNVTSNPKIRKTPDNDSAVISAKEKVAGFKLLQNLLGVFGGGEDRTKVPGSEKSNDKDKTGRGEIRIRRRMGEKLVKNRCIISLKEVNMVRLLGYYKPIEKFFRAYYGDVDKDRFLFVNTEWMQYESLQNHLVKYKNKLIPKMTELQIAGQIAKGLSFCINDIVHHRDVRRRIIPEELKRQNEVYASKCELYCLAIVLWEISAHKFPFSNINGNMEIMEKVKTGKCSISSSDVTPERRKRLIKQTWNQERDERPEMKNFKKQFDKIMRVRNLS